MLRTWWWRARSPKAAGGCPEPLPEGGHRGAPAVPSAARRRGQWMDACAPAQSKHECRKRHRLKRQRPLLKLRQTSCPGVFGWDTASVGGGRLGSVLSGRLDGGWNHPTTMGLGCWGQPVLPWSSERQCWHRGMNRARPVKASL